jgi:hypothetical protein
LKAVDELGKVCDVSTIYQCLRMKWLYGEIEKNSIHLATTIGTQMG